MESTYYKNLIDDIERESSSFPLSLIDKYYPEDNKLRHILIAHSRSVAHKALAIASVHPELHPDNRFIYEAAMLHDIGIFQTNAPSIYCFGDKPYICHGFLGAEIVRNEGYPRHALVCERHTGTGLSIEAITERGLPVPHRDMRPVSVEEQIICFADKFFSKTHIYKEKTVEEAECSLMKFGEDGVLTFKDWCKRFL